MAKFFGILMSGNDVYEQNVTNPLRVTSMAIEHGEKSKIYITVDMEQFLVATLSRNKRQVTLDLRFCKGDHFKFESRGEANVSILGYIEPGIAYAIKSNNSAEEDESGYSPGASYPVSGSSSEKNDDLPMERDYGCRYGDEERKDEQGDNARDGDDADRRHDADKNISDDDYRYGDEERKDDKQDDYARDEDDADQRHDADDFSDADSRYGDEERKDEQDDNARDEVDADRRYDADDDYSDDDL